MAEKKYEKSYFDVLGLCCTSEVALIENILKSLDGVKEFSVVVPTKTLIVVHDHLLLSQLQIVKALNQARLEANVRMKGEGVRGYKKKWPSPFAMASGVLLAISLFKCVYEPLEWLALGAVAVGSVPLLFKAFASARHLRLDTSILMLIAVGGTIAIHDFLEAAAIVFLFGIGDWLESMAGHKANAAMSALMRIAPQRAVIAETGEEVDANQVKLNTVLAVKAGETIPIDGVVVDGTCEVDEKAFTGESHPVLKQKDSIVWAGTINLNGYISVKTTAVAEDCMVAKMAKLVEEAQSSRSKAQKFVDKCAQYYTPAIVIIAAGLAAIPMALRVENRRHWVHVALVFLVSGCPCALILSTPVASFCALTKAATNGVLIKGADHLENLAKVKVLAFDKTGTLTRGDFIVSDFRSLSNDISSHKLLYWVSSMESKSSHPMAAALVDYAKSLSINPNPENVEDFQNFPGEGISGIIDGKQIYIGNKKIGTRAGCTAAVPTLETDENKGKSVGYVYCDANPTGIFSLSDVCRTGAQQAVADLKSLHIKTAMLTGDTQASAMYIQQQLGNALDVVHSHLLPEEKSAIIKAFKKEGITAMVGDGVNDAPALATADIGISMGISGSALATETGHVILMSNDIRKVPQTIKLAGKTYQKVVQNVFLSIFFKAVVLAVAFSGHPLVWAAVLADVGTCLLVIFNSMLLLRSPHKHGSKGEKCCKNKKSVAKSMECCEKSRHCSSMMSLKPCNDSGEAKGNCCNLRDLEANDLHDSHDHKSSEAKKGGHCHSTHCSDDDHKDVVKGGHCHSTHCDDDNDHKYDVKKGGHCGSTHCNEKDHHSNDAGLVKENVELGSGHCHGVKKCCDGKNSNPNCSSENDIHEDTSSRCSSVDCEAKIAMVLEKREMGSCCKTYLKQCCNKHGHFGFGGGLCEIITE